MASSGAMRRPLTRRRCRADWVQGRVALGPGGLNFSARSHSPRGRASPLTPLTQDSDGLAAGDRMLMDVSELHTAIVPLQLSDDPACPSGDVHPERDEAHEDLVVPELSTN